MPEGDTIFRSARTLHLALAGRPVTRFDTVLPALQRIHDDHPIVGRTVEAVRAVGKHLLMEFSGGLTLRTHMRMNGSWHVYRPGERWRRPRSAARIVLANAEYEAIAFDVPVAEFLSARALDHHRELAALGPDLLASTFDAVAAAARLRACPDAAIADALLDQRVAAGVGNVFKSEVLFLCGIDPFTSVAALDDDELRRVVTTSRALLQQNVGGATTAGASAWDGSRRTTRSMDPAARLWVYGRRGRPCRRCGTSIACRPQGAGARLTFWCPSCQKTKPAGRQPD
jgi:endonuclease VIII